MMTPLYQELHRWKALPFIWGETDCMMVCADWVHRVRGVDPVADIRGTYDSRGTCQKETGFLRDPCGTVDRILNPHGIDRTNQPRRGDIAVIRIAEPDGRISPCGAIWLGSAWGCKGPTGTTTVHPRAVVEVMAVWGVGYEE